MNDINHKFIDYNGLDYSFEQSKEAANNLRLLMDKRRSIRHFSDKSVDQSIIEDIIMTASSAPSGANKQPWTFCAISNPTLKSKIRKAAEEEEYKSYHGRMSEEWLEDLLPFGTNWKKEFIEDAPWIIVVFKKIYNLNNDLKTKNYYVNESVGIATGFLISAIHQAGLVTLTHTPSPMGFLQEILNRPINEKPFLLLPVGYPKEHETIPDINRKKVEDVIVYM